MTTDTIIFKCLSRKQHYLKTKTVIISRVLLQRKDNFYHAFLMKSGNILTGVQDQRGIVSGAFSEML